MHHKLFEVNLPISSIYKVTDQLVYFGQPLNSSDEPTDSSLTEDGNNDDSSEEDKENNSGMFLNGSAVLRY